MAHAVNGGRNVAFLIAFLSLTSTARAFFTDNYDSACAQGAWLWYGVSHGQPDTVCITFHSHSLPRITSTHSYRGYNNALSIRGLRHRYAETAATDYSVVLNK
ncbi:hypothetical protein J6590_000213 [Homalodisca vitripennis]|nr:hypothetical protein J6590_000213 [Homalodisca vitripennis]